MSTEIDLDALEATAKAASQGLWEAEQSDETIELNKGTALTKWNEDGTVGTPARSWRSTDRLVEFDIEDLEDDEVDDIAKNLDHIVAARPEVVLALIERLRAAEGAAIPGGCIYCSSSGVYEDFDGVNQPCSACDGTGTPRVGTIYRELINSLSHVDEATDPILLAMRILACLKGDPNWESLEAPK